MIYIRALLHSIFVFGLLFIWQRIDKKQDYKNYLKVSLILGIPLGLGFDFAGVVLFKLWYYTSSNVFAYISILLATYTVITPVVIEVYNFLEKTSDKLLKVKLINTPSRYFYIIFMIISIILLILLSYKRIQSNNSVASSSFFISMFCLLVLLSDSILGLLDEEGVITKFLKGNLLSPLSIPISGIISGFLWEILNLHIKLWIHKNLPLAKFLHVPIYVILLWGTLNLAYVTAAKVARKLHVLK